MKLSLRGRMAALSGGAAIAATLTLMPAQAAAPIAGAVSVENPSTGPVSSLNETLETHGQCPSGTNVKARLTGPGIGDNLNNNLVGNTSISILNGNSYGGYELLLSKSLTKVLTNYGVTAPNGTYQVQVVCTDGSGTQDFADFVGNVSIVHAAADASFDGTYTYQPGATAKTTTTTLSAPAPASPVVKTTSVTLSATVTDAASATVTTGTVQFKQGATKVGAAVAVNGEGVATFTGTLAAGSGALSAAYVPVDAEAYTASTSAAVAYVVAGTPTLSGTAKVGKTLTCNPTAGGTDTYQWLVSGVASSATTKTVTVPGSWYAKTVACRVKVTVGTNYVTVTSAGLKIALGSALVATTRASIVGTMAAGHVVYCSVGKWSPAATAYTYLWKRSGVAYSSASKITLKTTDRGRYFTCTVTAKKAGYANGVSTSLARRVS